MEKKFVNRFFMVFIAIGVVIAIRGVGTVIDALRSTDWPPTEGSVTASGVDMQNDTDTERRTRALRYSPAVSYSYDVDGTTYSSDLLGFVRLWTDDESGAHRIARRYPVGQAVTVYYDPGDPSRAVLDPGVSLNSMLTLLFGLTWIAIMILVMYLIRGITAQ